LKKKKGPVRTAGRNRNSGASGSKKMQRRGDKELWRVSLGA